MAVVAIRMTSWDFFDENLRVIFHRSETTVTNYRRVKISSWIKSGDDALTFSVFRFRIQLTADSFLYVVDANRSN